MRSPSTSAWPAESCVTPGPRRATHPIISWPRMMGSGIRPAAPSSPCHRCTSEPQMDATSTLTRMAPGSNVSGMGTSRISRGFWNATTHAARLVFGMVLTCHPPQNYRRHGDTMRYAFSPTTHRRAPLLSPLAAAAGSASGSARGRGGLGNAPRCAARRRRPAAACRCAWE